MKCTIGRQARANRGHTLTETIVGLVVLLLLAAVFLKVVLLWIRAHPQLSSFAFGFLLALIPMWAVAEGDSKGLGLLLLIGLVVVLIAAHFLNQGGPEASSSKSTSAVPEGRPALSTQ